MVFAVLAIATNRYVNINFPGESRKIAILCHEKLCFIVATRHGLMKAENITVTQTDDCLDVVTSNDDDYSFRRGNQNPS